MILKLTGAVLLSVAGWHAGASVCHRITIHKQALREIVELLTELQAEIAYHHGDLKRFYKRCQEENKYEYLHFPKEEWIQTLAPPQALTREEKRLFVACFRRMGYSVAEHECTRIHGFLEQFVKALERTEQEERRALALDRKVGLAIGAMVALVLL